MANPLLDVLGIKEPGAAAAAHPTSSPKYSPEEAALRTVFSESSPDPEERRWVAGVIGNRYRAAKTKNPKATLLDVLTPGEFEVWKNGSVHKVDTASDDYKKSSADLLPILTGAAPSPTDADHFYGPKAQAALAPKDGRPVKPGWDNGKGIRVGQTMFVKAGESAPSGSSVGEPINALMAALNIDPKLADQQAADRVEFVEQAPRDPSTFTKAQQETARIFSSAGLRDDTAPFGSARNPRFTAPDATTAPPGDYYVDPTGKLNREPGGKDESDPLTGIAQGGKDLLLSLMKLAPGSEDSTIRNRMDADRMVYDANYGGNPGMGAGRFAGQVGASLPLMAGAELAATPALMKSAAGRFLIGKGGMEMAPGLARFGARAGSLATYGAVQGAAGAGLVSAASDVPVGEQMLLGGLAGGVLGPAVPAAALGGKFLGDKAGAVFAPMTEGGRERMVSNVLLKASDGGLGSLDTRLLVPGVQPTLAEAAGNAGISGLQRAASDNPLLVNRFQARQAANDAARASFLDNVRGDPQSLLDLAAAREPIVRAARDRAFTGATEAQTEGLVKTLDDALASPEAQMDEVRRPLQALRDKVVNDAEAMTPAELKAFNREVLASFGGTGDALTPEAMTAARAKLGAKFEELAGKTNVLFDDELQQGMANVLQDASMALEEAKGKPLQNIVAQIQSLARNGRISGEAYKNLIRRGGPLDAIMSNKSDGVLANYAGQLREVLDDALERTMASDFPGDHIPVPKDRMAAAEDFAPKADTTDLALELLRNKKSGGGGRGPSLADALIKGGGLRDDAGEIAALDPKNSYGKRGGLLMRGKGMTLEDATTWAADNGYIQPRLEADGSFDPTKHLEDFKAALRSDLDGNRVYGRGPTASDEVKAHADELEEMLSEIGADLSMPNGRIKQKVAEYFGTAVPEPTAPAPKAGKTKEEFDALLAETRAKTAVRDTEAARLAADDKPVRFTHDTEGRQALVSPDLDTPGKWRLTRLDSDGPVGHTVYETKAEAVTDALREHYQPPEGPKVFHGSKATDLSELKPGERGPFGAAVYVSPDNRVAGRYAGPDGKVYEAPEPGDIFQGIKSRDSSVNSYDVWRDQIKRLVDAAPENERAALAELGAKMQPDDGYPFFRRLSQQLGGDAEAQALLKKAGFKGISGTVDGPEIAIFENVPLGGKSAGGAASPAAAAPVDPTVAAGRAAVDELRATRLAYKNLKTAERAVGWAGVDKMVTPNHVLTAVKQNFKNYAYSGGGPLGDAAEAAVKAVESKGPLVQKDARQLYGMRENLSTQIDKLEAVGTDAATQAADRLKNVREAVDAAIETGAPAYREFLAVAERSHEPISARRYLQGLSLTNANGTPTFAKVQGAIDRIEKARAEPGKNPAKLISEATLEQLTALRDDLQRAQNVQLGKAAGSDTHQRLAVDKMVAEEGLPIGVFGAAFSGHPLGALAIQGGKLFGQAKGREAQQLLATRLLDPERFAATPLKSSKPLPAPVRALGRGVAPVAGAILSNRITSPR